MCVRTLAACVAGLMSAGPAFAATTTFDDGIEGWGLFFSNDGTLGDFVESTGGNPGAHLRWLMVDTFGATFRNDSNADFIGDYSRFGGPVRLAVDVQVQTISFFGNEVPRNLIVELVDYNDDPANPYPSTSVWYNLGEISLDATADWKRFEVVIADPSAVGLPAGWGGTGAEDSVTFEPVLPPGRTFADVLANVEEIRFTTFEPGFFYGFTNYELRFDNPTLVLVPEPATLMLAGGALLLALRRR
jgi:hypothetical protein